MFLRLKVPFNLLILSIISTIVSVGSQANTINRHEFIHSNVLGTSLEITIEAPLDEAESLNKNILIEIKRLEKIFSTYDKSSEVSQLNRQGHINRKNISNDLLAVVKHCEAWQKKLPKSFSCRLGNVINMWQSFEDKQKRPDRISIRSQARKAQQSKYTSDNLLAGKSNTDFTWDFGGIAKGYILDQAMKIAKSTAIITSAIKIDIGGDGIYWQQTETSSQHWLIGIAIPESIDDSQENNLGTYKITNAALAYSGHNIRARKIGRQTYSHILQPRDGWPTHNPVTAIVKAPTAAIADTLATALAATDISSALDWLDKHHEYAALLIDRDGRQYSSNNWPKNYNQTPIQKLESVKDYQAKISFSLPKLNVAEYRKPYVAIWIENKKRVVVKNIMILGQDEQWMQKNRSWWRIQGRKSPYLLDGFARSTRRAGEYSIRWNGKDDYGQQLPTGQYTLYAEAAREHGDHEKVSLKFELGAQQSLSTKGKKEIKNLLFESPSSNTKI